jgi:hypothetical protein
LKLAEFRKILIQTGDFSMTALDKLKAEYAPYDAMPAFAAAFESYIQPFIENEQAKAAGRLSSKTMAVVKAQHATAECPYTMDTADHQAWDRGLEAASRWVTIAAGAGISLLPAIEAEPVSSLAP